MVDTRERLFEASYTAKRQEDIGERGEKERRQGINDAFSALSLFRMLSELGYGI
jgi:hypothetical protein